jgi:hypothetical protein
VQKQKKEQKTNKKQTNYTFFLAEKGAKIRVWRPSATARANAAEKAGQKREP